MTAATPLADVAVELSQRIRELVYEECDEQPDRVTATAILIAAIAELKEQGFSDAELLEMCGVLIATVYTEPVE
jgi:hypothetical protein